MEGSQVRGKNVSVIGAARSGVAVARLLQHYGARPFVSDKTAADKLKAESQTLNGLGI